MPLGWYEGLDSRPTVKAWLAAWRRCQALAHSFPRGDVREENKRCACLTHCLYSLPSVVSVCAITKGTSMSSRLLIAVIASVLVFGLGGVVVVVSALEAFRPLPPGKQQPAPAFTLPDHRGLPLHSTDLHGKVVVVRFWATW
jgi:hypothetical protein